MKIILLALLLTGCAVNEDQRELDIFMSELKVKERSLELLNRVNVPRQLTP
jgi:hypothetical protein